MTYTIHTATKKSTAKKMAATTERAGLSFHQALVALYAEAKAGAVEAYVSTSENGYLWSLTEAIPVTHPMAYTIDRFRFNFDMGVKEHQAELDARFFGGRA